MKPGKFMLVGYWVFVKIYENKELNDYVNQIGRHIANHTDRPDLPWTFSLLSIPMV